jgi:hypothetical protein
MPESDLNVSADELKPKHRMTEEQKRKMREGRLRYRENLAAKKAAQREAPTPEGISGKSVQTRGVLMTIDDGMGHSWTVPADDTEDYRLHRSPFEIKTLPGYDPKFDYQFENMSDVGPMLTNDWVIVTRKELGLPSYPADIPNEYGLPLSGAHMVEKQVCLKKPKVLVDRTRAAHKRFADAIVNQIAPPQNSAKNKLEHEPGGIVTDSIVSSTTFKEPARA